MKPSQEARLCAESCGIATYLTRSFFSRPKNLHHRSSRSATGHHRQHARSRQTGRTSQAIWPDNRQPVRVYLAPEADRSSASTQAPTPSGRARSCAADDPRLTSPTLLPGQLDQDVRRLRGAEVQQASARSSVRQLHSATTVVRFALESNLDAYPTRSEGPTARGRQELARALSITPGALTGRLKTRPGLGKLVGEMESRGFAQRGTVSRLADQVELLPTDTWSIEPHWWPRLRDGYDLGTTGRLPTFDRAFEVLLTAEAFAAAHPLLLQKPPNRPVESDRISDNDLVACGQLLDQLCWLASGPFGVAYESQRLISYLAPVSPSTVTGFIASGVITTQVIRALDRSLRRCAWSSEMRQQYTNLLASPPSKIYRRTNWMRSLRRLRLLDYADPETRARPARDWLMNQLVIALNGEESYLGARATDRRYAFWCLAELAPTAESWARVRNDAASLPEIAPLLEPAEMLRKQVQKFGLAKWDAFQFSPPGGWAVRTENHAWSHLLDENCADTAKGPPDHWAWARPRTRMLGRALLQDALFNPDVIKQRSSTDALGAAGSEMREAVAITIAAFCAQILKNHDAPRYLIERCLAILGMMGRASSAATILDALRSLSDESLVQAVASAGDLAHLHASERPWLLATVIPAVTQKLNDEDVAIAGITALVAGHSAPREAIPQLAGLPSTAVQATLGWADRVARDRKRFEQSNDLDTYPASHQP